MNKQVVIALIAVFAIVGIVSWTRSETAASRARGGPQASVPASAASPLVPSETLYDFGAISMKNGLAEHRFNITNPTDVPVRLKSVFTSCMCTKAFLDSPAGVKGPFGMQGMGSVPPADELIAPGQSREVRVVYDPNAHGPAGVGQINRFVYLIDDTERVLRLEIKATVTP